MLVCSLEERAGKNLKSALNKHMRYGCWWGQMELLVPVRALHCIANVHMICAPLYLYVRQKVTNQKGDKGTALALYFSHLAVAMLICFCCVPGLF